MLRFIQARDARVKRVLSRVAFDYSIETEPIGIIYGR